MTETATKHILIIEKRAELRERMQSFLTQSGYEIIACDSVEAAAHIIENSAPPPFCLIISNYRIHGTNGEELLKKAAIVYPDTPRILISEASDLHAIVGAINSAGIYSCLSIPFEDNELLLHVEKGIEQYLARKKQKHLKRISDNQNNQMFRLANKLKEKEEQSVTQINEKKTIIAQLTSKIESVDTDRTPAIEEKEIILETILEEKGIVFSSENFASEFQNIKMLVKEMLNNASQNLLEVTPLSSGKTPLLDEEPLVNALLSLIYRKTYNDLKKLKNVSPLMPLADMEAYLELSLSENKAKAYLHLKKMDEEILTVKAIKRFLFENDIIIGIKNDHIIETWIENATPEDHPFMIAQGTTPVKQKDAEITYHFPTDFLGAGKMNPDGSIDFRERGKIPFIQKETLLCEKKLPSSGVPGIDVTGHEIPVEKPVDLSFSPGPGTILSEDGTRIYAVIDGQPHLNAMGTVSVFPEMKINGDIGYKTGNIDFEGNVFVAGSVKQGFSVKCASLTAEEIESAGSIDLSGDLNISSGILNAHNIRVMGSVHAKYINASSIDSLGDMVVSKEIIDSTIRLSGALIVETGTIISSDISAKMGITARDIGTDVSKPSVLTVGIDTYVDTLLSQIDNSLQKNQQTCELLKQRIQDFEQEYEALHPVISSHSFAQDKYQSELRNAQNKLTDLQASGEMVSYQKIKKNIEILQKKIKEKEADIQKEFERQDNISQEIEKLNENISLIEQSIQKYKEKKSAYIEFASREKPVVEVRVSRKLMPKTTIIGPNSKVTIKASISKCRIIESAKTSDGPANMPGYEIKLIPY